MLGEERSRGYGDGFVACGEKTPAVATALSDVEFLAILQQVEHEEVVDAALGALREAKSRRGAAYQVAVLDAHEATFLSIIRYLQPGSALTVFP